MKRSRLWASVLAVRAQGPLFSAASIQRGARAVGCPQDSGNKL